MEKESSSVDRVGRRRRESLGRYDPDRSVVHYPYLLWLTIFVAPILFFFAYNHIGGEQSVLGYLCLLAGIHLVTSVIVTFRRREAQPVLNNTGLLLFCLLFAYLTFLSNPTGKLALWSVTLPPAAFLVSGGRIGVVYSILIITLNTLILFGLGSLFAEPWDEGFRIRFILSLVVVSLLSYLLDRDRNYSLQRLFSEKKRLEKNREELYEARKTAEEASEAKSRFLASMSHELRTPLHAIIGFAEVLDEEFYGALGPKQKKYVGDIQSSGRHLLELINEVLDLSKVESGKMDLHLESFDLAPCIKECFAMIQERARAHDITLSLDLPQSMEDAAITADRRKMKQVLFNLLSNAVKFTPDGGTVTVTVRETDDQVSCSVRDTGIGLTEKALKHVFDTYYQAESPGSQTSEGTGLGLALTRGLVELHGGSLEVRSDGPGTGAEFTVTLPKVPPEFPAGNSPGQP